MTYLDLITDAYRLRNVIDENESPSAEQGVSALRKFNQMMARWDANGIRLQYVPIDADDLDEELTIPDWSEEGVTAQLAIRLGVGAAITPELQTSADEGMDTIRSKTVVFSAANMDHLPSGEGSCKGGGLTEFNQG